MSAPRYRPTGQSLRAIIEDARAMEQILHYPRRRAVEIAIDRATARAMALASR